MPFSRKQGGKSENVQELICSKFKLTSTVKISEVSVHK